MIRAVAWDVDGTLVDSEPLHLRALRAVCEAFSVDITDLADDHFIGVNLHDIWEVLKIRHPDDLQRVDWIAQINSFYAANKASLEPIPHAVEVIRKLHAQGIPQVAVSNSNRVVVDANLDVLGVSDLVGISLSLDDVDRGKPDPLPYLMAAKHLGLRPHEILAVEDSASGVRSARAAGLKVAGLVHDGNAPTGSDFRIEGLIEVLEIVSKVDADGI